jgi:hypothetical protein
MQANWEGSMKAKIIALAVALAMPTLLATAPAQSATFTLNP